MRRSPIALFIILLLVASTLVVPASGEEPEDEDRWGTGWHTDHSDYIVVAPADWEDTLQPLIEWRSKTSLMKPVFVSLEEATSVGTGHDRAARLKENISDFKDEYAETYHNALLLVGDAEVLPVRWVFADILQNGNVSDPLNFRWTDDYYAYGNESTWNRDGDHIYGEDGEVLTEVATAFHPGNHVIWQVGRIPASTELELERYIDKLLAYERTPPPGDWYTSALVVSGLMDVPNHLDNPYTPDVDGGYELFSDNSYESHTKLQDIIPDRYDRTWLYDYPQLEGGDWNRSVDTLEHDSVVAAFDQGHSIMAMNGHGWIDGSGLAHYNGSGNSNYWWDWHNAYDYTDADNASNGGKLPWVYVAACYVGDVTIKDDKTLERLVMNPKGGAIGMVAGNGENYKGESMANASYGNWFLERTFWTNYFQWGPSKAMHRTKQAYLGLVSGEGVPHKPLYDAYYIADYLSHNLLGDPLTMVWTDVPDTLKVSSLEDVPADRDAIVMTVTDGEGMPVPNALVYVGWDGNHTFNRSDADGGVKIRIPVDAGELEIVVSAENHIPAATTIDRPVTAPDLEITGVTWWSEAGVEGEPILNGEEVTLEASIDVHGRYDFDQARVRFSVAPENGDFERLVPDVFTAVWTGTVSRAFINWTPPWPGSWQVRAEVNPAGELPDRTIMNNFGEATLAVQGPPRWETLPTSISMDCGDAPGGHYDLKVHVSDPDTPPDGLTITAEAIGEVPGGVTYQVDDQGRLVVCSSLPRASFLIGLEVTDGTYTDMAEVLVEVGRSAPRLRLAGETFHTATEGGTVTGSLSIENLGPGEVEEGMVIVDLSGNLLFTITPDGAYAFEAAVHGIYQVRVGIQRGDGTTEHSWQGAILSFQVTPDAGLPPQPYGWKDLHVVEGQKVIIHLQAVDLEGGSVTYLLVSRDGLDASIDPTTGMLTIRPTDGDVGKHKVTVSLSDGTEVDDYVLQVFVTESPSSGTAIWLVIGLGLALMFGAAIYLVLRSRQDQD